MKPKKWTKRDLHIFSMGKVACEFVQQNPEFHVMIHDETNTVGVCLQGEDGFLLVNQFPTAQELEATLHEWAAFNKKNTDQATKHKEG